MRGFFPVADDITELFVERQIANFVEEKSAAVGRAEQAHAHGEKDGVGRGAADAEGVAVQHAFHLAVAHDAALEMWQLRELDEVDELRGGREGHDRAPLLRQRDPAMVAVLLGVARRLEREEIQDRAVHRVDEMAAAVGHPVEHELDPARMAGRDQDYKDDVAPDGSATLIHRLIAPVRVLGCAADGCAPRPSGSPSSDEHPAVTPSRTTTTVPSRRYRNVKVTSGTCRPD